MKCFFSEIYKVSVVTIEYGRNYRMQQVIQMDLECFLTLHVVSRHPYCHYYYSVLWKVLSYLLFTCFVIMCFHFLLLFCNRKSEIEAKRKQEEEERKKREEEEKRIQVNVLAVCEFGGFFGCGCWWFVLVFWFLIFFLIFFFFHSLGSPLNLMASFYKYVSQSHSTMLL